MAILLLLMQSQTWESHVCYLPKQVKIDCGVGWCSITKYRPTCTCASVNHNYLKLIFVKFPPLIHVVQWSPYKQGHTFVQVLALHHGQIRKFNGNLVSKGEAVQWGLIVEGLLYHLQSFTQKSVSQNWEIKSEPFKTDTVVTLRIMGTQAICT